MSILELSERITDPRSDKNKIHEVSSIVFISLVAVICGCDTWYEIQMFGEANIGYFKERLPRLNAIPSHDTFNRFFSALDPKAFEEVFRTWVEEICEMIPGVIAIDGKAVCSNPDHAKKGKGSVSSKLYMVSAWSVANGICLGQERVSGKSNEIKAIPKLIKALDLKGCIVTIDAIGCQRKIASAIRRKKGHYILAVKGNQKKLKERLQINLDDNSIWADKVIARHTTTERAHGRLETRECICLDYSRMSDLFLPEWKDARTLVKVVSTRKCGRQEPTSETRFYITSLQNDPVLILESIRSHWQVENSLHWRLDVAFREDFSRKRGNAAVNFSALSKMAMEMLKGCNVKVGLASKRKACAWDYKLRDTVLGISK